VQHQVGNYRLDIVVAGPNGRLAIECDGDRWHGEDLWHRDRARQEVLERAGWTFERIRGSSFFRHPEIAMEPVWRHLESLGIPTGDEWIVNSPRRITREVSETAVRATAEPANFREEPVSDAGRRTLDAIVNREAPGTVAPESGFDDRAGRDDAKGPADAEEWLPPAWYLSGGGVDQPTQPAEQPASRSTRAAPETPNVPLANNPKNTKKPLDSPSSTRVNSAAGSLLLRPYLSWPTRPLPPVDSDDGAAVMHGLAEIIRAEGPMHAALAYQRYTKAAGAQRIGREAHRLFDALNVRGVRTGQWLRIKDRVSNPSGATLYGPGTPPVVLRERGPRDLIEIPRSEIKSLMNALELDAGVADLKRAVLRELGFIRMTDRTADYLDQCLRYKWNA
jgi:hypothetical protein